jgi:hypothetical protein
MKKHRFAMGAVVLAFRLTSTAALALCLVQCSAEQPTDVAGDENLGSVSQALERCGNKACSSPVDCTVGMPACALTAGAKCFNGTECTYKLDTGSSTCPCIEHDVRLCTVAGSGAAGVQICRKLATAWTTWDPCTTTPVCTP